MNPQRRWKVSAAPKRTGATLLAGSAAVLIAACGSSIPSSSGTASASIQLTTMTAAINYGTSVDFYYADTHDIWKKYGILMVPHIYDTGVEQTAAMEAGSADVADLGIPPALAAISHGLPVQIFYTEQAGGATNGLFVNPTSGITSVKGLVGKSVATPAESSADLALHVALKANGIPFSSVNVMKLGPPEALAAYERGQVQGVWIWSRWCSELEQLGAKEVANETQYGLGGQSVEIAKSSFIKSHQNLMARYVEALDAAALAVSKNYGLVTPILESYNNITASKANAVLKNANCATVTSSDLLDPKFVMSYVSSHGLLGEMNELVGVGASLGYLNRSLLPANLESLINVAPIEAAHRIELRNDAALLHVKC